MFRLNLDAFSTNQAKRLREACTTAKLSHEVITAGTFGLEEASALMPFLKKESFDIAAVIVPAAAPAGTAPPAQEAPAAARPALGPTPAPPAEDPRTDPSVTGENVAILTTEDQIRILQGVVPRQRVRFRILRPATDQTGEFEAFAPGSVSATQKAWTFTQRRAGHPERQVSFPIDPRVGEMELLSKGERHALICVLNIEPASQSRRALADSATLEQPMPSIFEPERWEPVLHDRSLFDQAFKAMLKVPLRSFDEAPATFTAQRLQLASTINKMLTGLKMLVVGGKEWDELPACFLELLDEQVELAVKFALTDRSGEEYASYVKQKEAGMDRESAFHKATKVRAPPKAGNEAKASKKKAKPPPDGPRA